MKSGKKTNIPGIMLVVISMAVCFLVELKTKPETGVVLDGEHPDSFDVC